MIIIPTYDADGRLNYFTARSFEKDPYIKYRNPYNRNTVNMERTGLQKSLQQNCSKYRNSNDRNTEILTRGIQKYSACV